MRGRGTPRDRANIKEQRVLPLEEASPTRTRATGSSSEVMPIPNMQAPMMSVVPPIVMPPSTTVANTTVPFQSTPPNAVTVLSAPQWTPPDSTTDIREVQELTRNLRKRRKRISLRITLGVQVVDPLLARKVHSRRVSIPNQSTALNMHNYNRYYF